MAKYYSRVSLDYASSDSKRSELAKTKNDNFISYHSIGAPIGVWGEVEIANIFILDVRRDSEDYSVPYARMALGSISLDGPYYF